MRNRGRFQAQDDTIEKSAAWATDDDISKKTGNEIIDSLQSQLTIKELSARIQSMQKVRDFVNNAPSSGYNAQIIKSYCDDIRNRKIRVDLEIRAGCAFITTKEN